MTTPGSPDVTRHPKTMHTGKFLIAYNPLFRVIATWAWWFVGAALTVLVILAIRGVPLAAASEALSGERTYLALYIEIVSVGLLPLVFTLICRDEPARYGLARRGWMKSLILSLLFTASVFAVGYVMTGRWMTDSRPTIHPDFPWNLWYGLLGILAWGPLEVFFFIWLIVNTEGIFKNRTIADFLGLLITVFLFTLIHILTTDIRNALYTGAIFLIMGLIFKSTRNAIGPMIAWTLINGQVWYMARLLF